MKVTYLNPEKVRQSVEQAVEALGRRRPEIRRVLLFGSLASGRATPGSDADLLIVLWHADRPFLERIPLYTPGGCSVGVDVFPYTQEELDAMQRAGNWLIRRALADGLEIYRSD